MELWRELEQRLGHPVPPEIRTFLSLEGGLAAYRDAEEPDKKRAIVEAMVDTVRHLWQSGASTIGYGEPIELVPDDDARWRLLIELDDEYRAAGAGDEEFRRSWRPLLAARGGPDQVYPFPASWVSLRFDHRLSQLAVIAGIRRLWPLLRERGWIRATRPLDERNLDLLRFVCLETEPENTWRQRLAAWNAAHPDRAYPDVRRFQTAFRRAEENLTDRRYGLVWFYNPLHVESEYLLGNAADTPEIDGHRSAYLRQHRRKVWRQRRGEQHDNG